MIPKSKINLSSNQVFLKARQIGMSTALADAVGEYLENPNKAVMYIGNSQDSNSRFLSKVEKGVKDGLIKANNPKELRCLNNSIIRCFSARKNTNPFVAQSCDLLIAEEVVFFNENIFEDVLNFHQMNDCNTIITSTAYEVNNHFHKFYLDTLRGNNNFEAHKITKTSTSDKVKDRYSRLEYAREFEATFV